ncbi:MAG TPA: hypothetical protein VK808_12845 [Bacteroidia bacterium]|jgi:hypothetical protein|nr:hypothetical protein [Bacteroidia bacterium]
MKNKLIAFVILAVTFLLPFRYAVLDVDSNAHGLSTFGVFFTGVGFIAGFYFLVKDDIKGNHGEEHSSH